MKEKKSFSNVSIFVAISTIHRTTKMTSKIFSNPPIEKINPLNKLTEHISNHKCIQVKSEMEEKEEEEIA